MRKRPCVFLTFSLLLILASCSSGQNRNNAGVNGIKPLEKGKVIASVACIKDPATSYAVYLPTTYSESKKFPLIIAFDPHASGFLPVSKYKDLAERYGTILIGSNNSKNGQPFNEAQNIINSMFEEVNLRFSIDTSRIYVMGFSGGARIASLVALYRGGIKGMIGCGAGFAGSDQPAKFRFDYIGFAGNADFNMNELISLDEQLEQANFRHALVIFDGKHEWPSDTVMGEAFFWNQLCAMKDGLIKKSEPIIGDFLAVMQLSLQKDDEQKDVVQKQQDLRKIIRYLQGIENVDAEKKELNELVSSDAYKREEKKIHAVREREMREQRMFSENFYLKDLNWWNRKITNYDLRIKSGTDREDVLMCRRIKSYLSLIAYMNYSGAIAGGEKEKSEFALSVYKIVDPENAAKIK